MAARDLLIARKGEVQARMHHLQPQVELARTAAEAATGPSRRNLETRAARLQAQLEALMQEEARLRLEIDRSSS